MLIKYRHFVEYEIPYPSDWKEQLLEQVNDEKERELMVVKFYTATLRASI